jgi:hypothetical protein
MNKLTIFTMILAACVITVTMDLAARDFIEGKKGQTSVLEATGNGQRAIGESQTVVSMPPEVMVATTTAPIAEIITEVPPVVTTPASQPTVTQEIVTQAGFDGDFKEEHFNGKVFQLLDITKNPVDGIGFFEISQDGVTIASVTEIELKDEIRALQLYVLLQNKTKPYIDLSLNETNAYGDRSFYINHGKKPDEAFLTVKIGRRLYAFAYVKTYHPQIKRLIQLLAQ